MLQQAKPQDFVIATGVQRSVRDFVSQAALELGVSIDFSGSGEHEIGWVVAVRGGEAKCKPGDVIVKVDPRYFRPTEVETLLGDPSKAKRELGWEPKVSIDELVREMVQSDYQLAKRDSLIRDAGYRTFNHRE